MSKYGGFTKEELDAIGKGLVAKMLVAGVDEVSKKLLVEVANAVSAKMPEPVRN